MVEPDITRHEKVTKTEKGFRMVVECKRGTDTRDQDKVKAELKTEEYPGEARLQELSERVTFTMANLRGFQPDKDDVDG